MCHIPSQVLCLFCVIFFFCNCTGCTGGIGRGKVLGDGLSGGGGHGGNGGVGCHGGTCVEGGTSYGSTYLPCELGSGSGNESLTGSTAGGGIVGKSYKLREKLLTCLIHYLELFSPARGNQSLMQLLSLLL